MARTVTIDIRTTANLSGINSTIGAVNRLQREIKSLATTAQVLNRALAPFKGARGGTGGLSNATRATTALTNATKQLAAAQRAAQREQERMNRLYDRSAISFSRQLRAANAKEEAAYDKSYIQMMNGLRRDQERSMQAAQRAQEAYFRNYGRLLTNATQMTQRMIPTTRQAWTSLGTSFTQAISTVQRLMSVLTSLGRLLGNTLRAAFTAAHNAARGFAQTGATLFASLQRAVQSTAGVFRSFASQVVGSLHQATNAVRNFYNAGWSLTAAGFMIQRAGQNIFSGMMGSLNTYMEYEKALTRTAIAASADPRVVQDLIFGLQRGEYEIGGQRTPIMQFSAEELAEGLYFYASAIGQQIDETTAAMVGPMVANIMAMAAATRTGLETATKGVLNIAMEFGIDPRAAALGNAEQQQLLMQVPALLGYLANISTMEVPDIVEAFKMVGPLAHILTDRNVPGAGLEETMALAFFASEVGLRGGNVGRGINQALTTLLDPTDKAIAAAAAAWGDEFGAATRENWRAFFFDDTGALEGGLTGFFDKLSRLSTEDSAAVIAEIFTTNAARSIVGIEQAIRQHGGIEGIVAEIGGDRPMEWLSEAFAETNDTIFANVQNLKNAWFQVTAEIIGTIQEPLKNSLRLISEIFFSLADVIRDNPWIGQFVVGLTTVVATVATVVGSMLALGGAILLTMKAFSMLGGLAHPFLLFLFATTRALLVMVPLFLALAAAGALLAAAWRSDFLGMRSSLTGFFKDFDFDQDIEPRLEKIGGALRYTAAAFNDFAVGVLGGTGRTAVLGKWLMDVFGPILGPAFYAQMLRFRDSLQGVRDDIMNFIDGVSSGRAIGGLKAFTGALQGFFEFFVSGGTMQGANLKAWNSLMGAIGVDDSIGALLTLQRAFTQTLTDIVNAVIQLRNTLRPIFEQIGENLGEVFTGRNLLRALGVLREMIEGAFVGFAAIIVGAARAFEVLTRALANAGRAGEWLSEWTEKLFGLQTTAEGVARAIGITLGAALGIRLVAAITPGFAIITRLVPLLGAAVIAFTALGRATVEFAGHTVVLAARLTALTVAFVAQAAAMVITEFVSAALVTTIGLLLVLLGGWLAIMLIVVAQTEGWAGVTQGLANAWAGFMSIMGPAIDILSIIGGLIALVATQFGVAITSMEGFRLAGMGVAAVLVLVAASLGLSLLGAIRQVQVAIVALIFRFVAWTLVMGVQTVVAVASAIISMLAWATATGTVIFAIGLLITIVLALGAVIAGIVAIDFGAAFGDLINNLSYLGDIIRNSPNAWDDATKLMSLAIRKFFAVMIEEFWRGVANFVDAIQEGVSKWSGVGQVVDWMGLGIFLDVPEMLIYEEADKFHDTARGIQGEIDAMIADLEAQKKAAEWEKRIADALNPWGGDGGADEGTWLDIMGEKIDISGMLEKLGLDGLFAEGGQLSPTQLIDAMGFEEYQKTFGTAIEQAYGFSTEEILRNQYDQAMTAWDTYQKLIRQVGPRAAAAMYEEMGQPIPTNPGKYDAWLDDQLGQLEGAEEDITAKIKEMNDGIKQALTSMDIPKAMVGMFGAGSVADVLTQVGDQIMQNIGDAGPWLNMVELLADAAGTGLLGENITGQNIHEALRPALEIVAQQTGMSINDIMRDIPKFIAPQEFVPLATAELMEGLNEIPRSVYQTLDTLGTDFFDQYGNPMEQYGLEWAELTAYAVGQAVAGVDWNLADYLAESWGVSVDEANAYLASKGIDPNMITQEWFADTELLIASMGGQVNLITEEWYTWLGEMTGGFTTNVINLTKEAFDQLPDYVKLGLSNMGYTFVIGGQEVSAQAAAAARQITDSFEAAYGEPLEVIGTTTDEMGNEFVMLRTTLGEYIAVPAPEYAAWFSAMETIKGQAGATTGVMGALQDMLSGTVFGDLLNVDEWGGGAAPAIPGVPSPEDALVQGQEIGRQIVAGITSEVGSPTATTAFDELFKGYATAAVTAFVTQMQTDFAIQMSTPFGTGVAGEASSGPFDSVFKSYATTAMNAFVNQLVTEWTNKLIGPNGEGWVATTTTGPFDGVFRSYATTAVTAFKAEVQSQLSTWTPSFGMGTTTDTSGGMNVGTPKPQTAPTITAKLTLDKTAYDEGLWNAIQAGLGLAATTFTPKLTVDKSQYDSFVWAAIQSGTNFGNMTFTSSLDADASLFNAAIAAVRQSATNFVNTTYVGNLSANNAVALARIDDATWRAWAYDNTYTATLAVNDQASWTIASVIGLLWSLDGMVATSTIRTVQETVVPPTQYMASGGMVRAPLQIVGERGPEFAALSAGSRVYSNARSMGMLRAAVTSAMRDITIPVTIDIESAQKPRDSRPITTTAAFSQMRSWEVVPSQYEGRGDVKVEINNLHINKEVDIDKAVNRLDRLTGRRFELSRRGMSAYTDSDLRNI